MGEVVNSIKRYIRRDVPKKIVNINQLIRDSIRLVNPECRNKKVSIAAHLDDTLPSVAADPTRIEQVIINLMRNGWEAMQETPAHQRKLRLETGSIENRLVEVQISDAGSGIPEELSEKIFESFYTTKEEGLGLGLPLCRTILKEHGGKIWVTSNSDCGVTFHFTLPIASIENGE